MVKCKKFFLAVVVFMFVAACPVFAGLSMSTINLSKSKTAGARISASNPMYYITVESNNTRGALNIVTKLAKQYEGNITNHNISRQSASITVIVKKDKASALVVDVNNSLNVKSQNSSDGGRGYPDAKDLEKKLAIYTSSLKKVSNAGVDPEILGLLTREIANLQSQLDSSLRYSSNNDSDLATVQISIQKKRFFENCNMAPDTGVILYFSAIAVGIGIVIALALFSAAMFYRKIITKHKHNHTAK